MLRTDDLAEAVETGVITAEQAQALERIARERHRARAFAAGREERFRLMGGFNDFFIAIGVLLLGVALWWWPIVALPVMWGLAEYLTGRLKLVAPSILIVAILAASTALLAKPLGQTGLFAAAVAVVALHYWRFRLPFSLFVLALTGVGLVLSAVHQIAIGPFAIAPDQAIVVMRIVGLLVGLGVFAWALSFDVSDPERLTLRSDCGFWLHLIAAPQIMHTLAVPLMGHPLWPGARIGTGEVTGPAVAVVVLLVFALSTLALIVDRRALLVAGLGYLGSAMAYTLSKVSGADPSNYLVPTLVFLGILIIVLGVGWRHIRAVLMSALSGEAWKRHFPPYGTIA